MIRLASRIPSRAEIPAQRDFNIQVDGLDQVRAASLGQLKLEVHKLS